MDGSEATSLVTWGQGHVGSTGLPLTTPKTPEQQAQPQAAFTLVLPLGQFAEDIVGGHSLLGPQTGPGLGAQSQGLPGFEPRPQPWNTTSWNGASHPCSSPPVHR